ncbi:MAG TPA: hypothetical protein VMP68_07495 [Candidatus Eisenbacteria bacterium]|nr:hypothetical protein [Candidatus Eisenbacteria bacterium]
METLTRLVSESLARHGFDRPLDYRRLQWSRWFRCESHHSLLFVPSKPGIFALAEEIMSVGTRVPEARSPKPEAVSASTVEERPFRAASGAQGNGALAPSSPESESPRRMLAVTQFFEADDMAFVLDRMLSRAHAMHSRLESGRYFVRYVEIQDETQRQSICNALNQWIASSSEKATGIGSHFASSLELTPTNDQTMVGRPPTRANAESITISKAPTNNETKNEAPLEAMTASTVQKSPLFPSGF